MIEIRRTLTQVEDILHEFGPVPERPQRRGTIAIVIQVGTVKVAAREVTGEGHRPVCDAGIVRCE